MRYLIIILYFIPIASFAQLSKYKTSSISSTSIPIEKKFLIDSSGFRGPKLLDTLFYDNRQIKAIGYYPIDKKGNKAYYRVGQWIEYYQTGQIKSIGNYDLNYYYGCYNSRPGLRYYSFKKGDWTYFYENGMTKAKATYKVERIQVSDGVANQYENKSSITSDWLINH